MVTLNHSARRHGETKRALCYECTTLGTNTMQRWRKGSKEFTNMVIPKKRQLRGENQLFTEICSLQRESIWVLGTLETVGPDEGNRAPIMNGNGNFTTSGASKSTGSSYSKPFSDHCWPSKGTQSWTLGVGMKSLRCSDESKLTVWLSCHSAA